MEQKKNINTAAGVQPPPRLGNIWRLENAHQIQPRDVNELQRLVGFHRTPAGQREWIRGIQQVVDNLDHTLNFDALLANLQGGDGFGLLGNEDWQEGAVMQGRGGVRLIQPRGFDQVVQGRVFRILDPGEKIENRHWKRFEEAGKVLQMHMGVRDIQRQLQGRWEGGGQGFLDALLEAEAEKQKKLTQGEAKVNEILDKGQEAIHKKINLLCGDFLRLQGEEVQRRFFLSELERKEEEEEELGDLLSWARRKRVEDFYGLKLP